MHPGAADRALLLFVQQLSVSGFPQAEGSQEDFMKRDECILVDGADNIIGHANKYDSHRHVLLCIVTAVLLCAAFCVAWSALRCATACVGVGECVEIDVWAR